MYVCVLGEMGKLSSNYNFQDSRVQICGNLVTCDTFITGLMLSRICHYLLENKTLDLQPAYNQVSSLELGLHQLESYDATP